MKKSFPAFGNLLANFIVLIRDYKKPVTTYAFNKLLKSLLTKMQQDMTFRTYNCFEDKEWVDVCHTKIEHTIIQLLFGLEMIANTTFPLVYCDKHKELIRGIDEKTVIDIEFFKKIDTKKKAILAIVFNEFSHYNHICFEVGKPNFSDEILDRYFLYELCELNKSCYGKNGDPLLNYIISESQNKIRVWLGDDNKNDNNSQTVQAETILPSHFVLDKLKSITPYEFEVFCLEFMRALLKNEYTGSVVNVFHTGKTNDGGIDGEIVIETKLKGQQTHAIQCKQYSNNNIGADEIRNFIGAITLGQYQHGYFITTADFTKSAKLTAEQDRRITIINKEILFEYMQTLNFCITQKHIITELVFDDDKLQSILKKYK